LISATSASGVEAIDFAKAWSQHFDVVRKPVARGDTMEVAGQTYEVVWPPRTLVDTVVQKSKSILDQIEKIADANPEFRELLEDAYSRVDEGPFRTTESYDIDMPEPLSAVIDDTPDDAADTQDVISSDAQDEGDGENEGSWNDADLRSGRTTADTSSSRKEQPRKAILNKRTHEALIRDARKLQNDLSLVFHDSRGQSLIVYGDAPPNVVQALVPDLHASYDVQLAPHHGTHAMPRNAPFSRICVAQCNTKQLKMWRNHSRATDIDLAISNYEPRGIQILLDPWWARYRM